MIQLSCENYHDFQILSWLAKNIQCTGTAFCHLRAFQIDFYTHKACARQSIPILIIFMYALLCDSDDNKLWYTDN